jgi:hypothetical protein
MIDLVGPLDRNFAWDSTRLYDDADFSAGAPPPHELRGAAASVRAGHTGTWRILRDPLGINKLFWASSSDEGRAAIAARPRRLVDAGHPLEHIQAVPRGCVLDLAPSGSPPVQHSIVPPEWSSGHLSGEPLVEAIAGQFRSLLDGSLAALASAHRQARVFVAARRLAGDLGLSLVEATATEKELEHVDTVLVEGIDWRDFNVHAALVIATLAAAIDEAVPSHDGGGWRHRVDRRSGQRVPGRPPRGARQGHDLLRPSPAATRGHPGRARARPRHLPSRGRGLRGPWNLAWCSPAPPKVRAQVAGAETGGGVLAAARTADWMPPGGSDGSRNCMPSTIQPCSPSSSVPAVTGRQLPSQYR